MCGGTVRTPSSHSVVPGLSPRVRGNHDLGHFLGGLDGPIPACAGEPFAPRSGSRPAWAYPRVCGGTLMYARSLLPLEGLSPRVRGNQVRMTGRLVRFGPIPACAGEPSTPAFSRASDWAYPRVCGGTRARASSTSTGWGLSPRVRGNLQPAAEQAERVGPIPACAGEPPARLRRPVPTGAYPRVCGGTSTLRGWRGRGAGLSPRVRGNQRRTLADSSAARPIPACAGEPCRCCAAWSM